MIWFKFLTEWFSDIESLPIEERGIILDCLVSYGCGKEPQHLSDCPESWRGWLERRKGVILQNQEYAENKANKQSEGGRVAMQKRWGTKPSHTTNKFSYTAQDAKKDRLDLQAICVEAGNSEEGRKALHKFMQKHAIITANEYLAWCAVYPQYYQTTGQPPKEDLGKKFDDFTKWLDNPKQKANYYNDWQQQISFYDSKFPKCKKPLLEIDNGDLKTMYNLL